MSSDSNPSRREFLGKALGVVAIAAMNPLAVFLKPRDVLAAGNGFLIDLNSQTYSQLNTIGGSIRIVVPHTQEVFSNGDVLPYAFIVTRTTASKFSVLLGWCTHQHSALSNYDAYTEKITCQNPDGGHGSTYSVDGFILSGPSLENLTQYSWKYNPLNNTLEVFIPGLAVRNGQAGIQSVELYQNFPNPVKTITRIRFTMLYYSKVTLTVTDALGHIIAILHDGGLEAGEYSFDFDASIFRSGTYFYHLNGSGQMLTKQMEVVR